MAASLTAASAVTNQAAAFTVRTRDLPAHPARGVAAVITRTGDRSKQDIPVGPDVVAIVRVINPEREEVNGPADEGTLGQVLTRMNDRRLGATRLAAAEHGRTGDQRRWGSLMPGIAVMMRQMAGGTGRYAMAMFSDDRTSASPDMVAAALMFAEAQRVLVEIHAQGGPGRCRCGLEYPCVQAGSATAIRDHWLLRYRTAVAARQVELNADSPAGKGFRPVSTVLDQRLAA